MTKRIFQALGILAIPALLSGPTQLESSTAAGNWLVVSCNTDGTYTCSREFCLSGCCDKYIYPT